MAKIQVWVDEQLGERLREALKAATVQEAVNELLARADNAVSAAPQNEIFVVVTDRGRSRRHGPYVSPQKAASAGLMWARKAWRLQPPGKEQDVTYRIEVDGADVSGELSQNQHWAALMADRPRRVCRHCERTLAGYDGYWIVVDTGQRIDGTTDCPNEDRIPRSHSPKRQTDDLNGHQC